MKELALRNNMFKPGDTVSGYKIVKPLSRGGFSQIYKASDPDDKFVILKYFLY